MCKQLNKEEKLALIETFPVVQKAKDDGTTHQFTRGGEIKYYMKREYIQLADEAYLVYERPSIDTTIWYDDETESPDKHCDIVDVFVAHNMHYNRPSKLFESLLEKSEYHSIALLYTLNNYSYYSSLRDLDDYYGKDFVDDLLNKGYNKYVLTAEDIESLNNFYKAEDEKYLKRLHSYAKRYPDKLCCRGYWVNR